MNNKLEKKYGLLTAICMVVGIVVGSGVFFKAQDILNHTNGNMPLGILAWVLGGIVMIICSLNIANLGTHYEKVNGLVDYAEATLGNRYAFYVAWFNTFVYLPGMTSTLAWVSARYTVALFGGDIAGGLCMSLACFYMVGSYALNVLAPKLSGKFQVSTTFIKLVPLVLMAVVGTIVGLGNGATVESFKTASVVAEGGNASALFAAVVATAFAYEGWIIATSINAEIKNAKKNLPIALTVGCIIIMVIYIVYYVGLAGATGIDVLRDKAQGAPAAFEATFGSVGGTLLSVFVVVSCLGTLNGLMLASTRGLYAISARNQGPKPEMFSEVSKSTNMPNNASVVGLLMCGLFLFYFYGGNLMGVSAEYYLGKAAPAEPPIFGLFSFDSSELPIITLYAFYIPMFIMFIIKHGKENILKNVVLPILGIIASGFFVFAAFYAHGIAPYLAAKEKGYFSFPVLFYLIIFAVIMFIGTFFYKKKNNLED